MQERDGASGRDQEGLSHKRDFYLAAIMPQGKLTFYFNYTDRPLVVDRSPS